MKSTSIKSTLSIAQEAFRSKSSTQSYYVRARLYSTAIDRFITEDTITGSIDDPLSLNRYEYARDNPEAITDPTGHDWWSSLTSAVSNTVSSAVSTVTSAATSVGDDIVQAASNPENQAIALTVGVDALAVGAVALDVGSGGLATTLTSAAVGAAISTTAYTITHGDRANLGGALGAAASGAIVGAFSGGAGALDLSFFEGALMSSAGSALGDIAGSVITSGIDKTGFSLNRNQLLTDAIISGLTYNIGDNVGELVGSDIGRPATRLPTLWSGFLSPSEHPRAAYQAYSFLARSTAQYGVPFGEDYYARS